MKPIEGDYNAYYETYVSKAPNFEILEALSISKNEVISIFNDISEEKSGYAYAEGKWTIKELLSHMIDSERIFAYRALRVSRNDATPLPGFEQDDYVPQSNANNRRLEELLNEYELVRNSTLALFESFSDEMLQRRGTASNSPITVNALAYIISGHERHHIEVLKERYL